MCIRDRTNLNTVLRDYPDPSFANRFIKAAFGDQVNKDVICLLYTSDAADERSSVDLGGRRIIKKKTENEPVCERTITQHTT